MKRESNLSSIASKAVIVALGTAFVAMAAYHTYSRHGEPCSNYYHPNHQRIERENQRDKLEQIQKRLREVNPFLSGRKA